jgi:hypothetical protein
MKYVVRTLIGMGLFAFCWAVTAYAIFQLLSVGTCASGGPYVVARECPGGIERVMLALTGAIFLLFVAAFIYSIRGRAPGSGRDPDGGLTILWFWSGLFFSLAVGCFLAVWGPEANPGPGATAGGLIVGFMGLIFGLGGLLAVGFLGKNRKKTIDNPDWNRFAPRRRPPDPAANYDALSVLDGLRAQGKVNDAEYQTLRSRIGRR